MQEFWEERYYQYRPSLPVEEEETLRQDSLCFCSSRATCRYISVKGASVVSHHTDEHLLIARVFVLCVVLGSNAFSLPKQGKSTKVASLPAPTDPTLSSCFPDVPPSPSILS